jgi:hypothetical protein
MKQFMAGIIGSEVALVNGTPRQIAGGNQGVDAEQASQNWECRGRRGASKH